MGGKSQTQTNTSSQSYTPAGLEGLQDIWSKLQSAASQPYQAYTGQMVAGLTPEQQAGIANVNQAGTSAQPYLTNALNTAQAASQPISQNAINSYMSPYTQQVVDATRANFNETNAQDLNRVKGNAIAQGALGGNRRGVAEAETIRQQKLAQDPVIANLYQQGYGQALGAAQADRSAAQAGAGMTGNLANALQTSGIQGGMAQIGAGGVAQQNQQQNLTNAYNQFMQQQSFPYQQAQFLASLGVPTLSAQGGSTIGSGSQTSPGPSPWGQIAGLGATALSMFSDERVKDNIEPVGMTFDGQNIYKYNYKGIPTTQMGLLAQEVEEKHPEAVGSVNGIKTVNYDAATSRYASGGSVSPYEIPEVMGYIPKPISIATSNVGSGSLPSMGGNSNSGSKDSGLPSNDTMKGLMGALKGLGSDMFMPMGGNYDANMLGPAMTGSTGMVVGGLRHGGRVGYADGGSISPFEDRFNDVVSPFAGTTLAAVPVDIPLAAAKFASEKPDDDIPLPQARPQPVTGETPFTAPVTRATPTAGYSDNLGKYGKSIAGIESGGRYDALGPVIDKTGDRAYGKYQVMGANIPEWTKEILGKPLTPEQFLKSPEAQDAVFRGKFGQYANKYGPEGASRAWFAGEGGMNNPMARDQLGTTVADYLRKFMGGLGGGQDAGDESIPPAAMLTQAKEQPKSSLGGWNPFNLSDEARQGLMAAGLGMMASKSPFALTQIGEGGLQGLKNYQELKSSGADRAMKQKQFDLQAQEMARKAQQFAQQFSLSNRNADETKRYHDILDQQRKDALEERKTRSGYIRNADGTMTPIEGGPADPKQIAAVAKARKTGELLPEDTADFLAERVLAGDAKALIGLGRGAQGAENITKIQGLVAKKALERGMNAQDILAKTAEQSGLTAQQRTFGTQVARMAVNSTEAQGAIELGREASKLVPRTNWVPVNRAIQAYQKGTSDPALAKFGAANLAIINTYSRAISPTGVPTVHDKQHAEELLSTAMGPEAYEAVLEQMNKEIEIAHAAPLKAKKEMENIRKSGQNSDAPSAPAAPLQSLTRPKSVPEGSAYSPSRKQWRSPEGVIYNERGERVQ